MSTVKDMENRALSNLCSVSRGLQWMGVAEGRVGRYLLRSKSIPNFLLAFSPGSLRCPAHRGNEQAGGRQTFFPLQLGSW